MHAHTVNPVMPRFRGNQTARCAAAWGAVETPSRTGKNCVVPDLENIARQPLRQMAGPAVVGVSTGGAPQVVSTEGAASDTPFRIASLTKPFTAVTAVKAAGHAGVGLDTPVLDVLSELGDDWAADRQLTIAEVLSQISGLAATVSADEVRRLGEGDTVSVEAARLVVRAGNARPRGRAWEYYNGNYFLVGALIATLTGTTYEDAVAELVLRPWGLTATSFQPPSGLAVGMDRGIPVAATPYPRGRRPSGGLCSTAADLLAFGEHLLGDADLLAQVRRIRTRPDDSLRYGLGWAIGPSGQMYLNGRLPGYRAALLLVPEGSLVAVTLAADSDALPAQARILSELQRDLTGDDIAPAIDGFAA
jgi:D-alanyl-D-alanine carboxypeptidase